MRSYVLTGSLLLNLFLIVAKNDTLYLHRAADKYYKDTLHAYMRGCKYGTDYEKGADYSPNGFNLNSSTNYCNRARDLQEDYYGDHAGRLAEKRIR